MNVKQRARHLGTRMSKESSFPFEEFVVWEADTEHDRNTVEVLRQASFKVIWNTAQQHLTTE